MVRGQDDTIFALASGLGRGAISTIRLSGQGCAALLLALCGGMPPPRRASLRLLRDSAGGLLDQAIVLWMPGPRSYTGEDSAELHVHGGLAVRAAVSAALLTLGARPAEAGEFSRRAYLAGKMDLLEAEGIADLVSAETEAQRKQALRQLSGAASEAVIEWAARLKRGLAFQEALIDFPDESMPENVEAELLATLRALLEEMRAELTRAPAGERLRHGLLFAIVGAPNVGKSSLLNALARRDVAIVSPQPGTTRDAIEVTVDLQGVRVTLVDTAGLRDTDDTLEEEGMRRARTHAANADLLICVVEATYPKAVLQADLVVANKIDLAQAPGAMLGVSVLSGEGMEALEKRLAEEAIRLTGAGTDPVLTQSRHVAAVRDAAAALESALDCNLPELRAEDLRLALAGLGRLTGTMDAEAILDDVFSAFCIGK